MEEKEAIDDILRIFTDPIVLYHHAGAEILPGELANMVGSGLHSWSFSPWQ